jgi:hypothetical protein
LFCFRIFDSIFDHFVNKVKGHKFILAFRKQIVINLQRWFGVEFTKILFFCHRHLLTLIQWNTLLVEKAVKVEIGESQHWIIQTWAGQIFNRVIQINLAFWCFWVIEKKYWFQFWVILDSLNCACCHCSINFLWY